MSAAERAPAVSGRVLIVDDDECQRSALAAMLADCDFDTRVVGDGQEALEQLTAFKADVARAVLARTWTSRFPDAQSRAQTPLREFADLCWVSCSQYGGRP